MVPLPDLQGRPLAAVAECLEVDGVIELTAAEAVVTVKLSGRERDILAYNAPAAKCLEQLLRHASHCNVHFTQTATSSQLSIGLPAETVKAMPLLHDLIHSSRSVAAEPMQNPTESADPSATEQPADGADGSTSKDSSKRQKIEDKKAIDDKPAAAKFAPPCSVWGLVALALIARGLSIDQVLASSTSDPSLASHTLLMADFLNAQQLKSDVLAWLQRALAAITADCKHTECAKTGGQKVPSSSDGKAAVWWYTQVLEKVPPLYMKQLSELEGSKVGIQDAAILPASLLCKWLEVAVESSSLSLRGGALTTKQWERILACWSWVGSSVTTLDISDAVVSLPRFTLVSQNGTSDQGAVYQCSSCLTSFPVCGCGFQRGYPAVIAEPLEADSHYDVHSDRLTCRQCRSTHHACVHSQKAFQEKRPFPLYSLETAVVSFRNLECLLLTNMLLFPSDADILSLASVFTSVAASLRTLVLNFRLPAEKISEDGKKHFFAAVAQLTQLEELVFPWYKLFVGDHTAATTPLKQLERLKHVQVLHAKDMYHYGIKFVQLDPEQFVHRFWPLSST